MSFVFCKFFVIFKSKECIATTFYIKYSFNLEISGISGTYFMKILSSSFSYFIFELIFKLTEECTKFVVNTFQTLSELINICLFVRLESLYMQKCIPKFVNLITWNFIDCSIKTAKCICTHWYLKFSSDRRLFNWYITWKLHCNLSHYLMFRNKTIIVVFDKRVSQHYT